MIIIAACIAVTASCAEKEEAAADASAAAPAADAAAAAGEASVESHRIREAISRARLAGESTIEINRQMRLGESYEATLVISRGQNRLATKIITESAPPVAATIPVKIANEVHAEASAPDIDIRPNSPEWQNLSNDTPAVWSWTLSPRKAGRSTVTFTLYEKINVDGREGTYVVDRYPQSVTVLVTAGVWYDQVLNILKQPIALVVELLALIVAGFTIYDRFKKKSAGSVKGRRRP